MHHNLGVHDSCAAKIFKINQRKAKILIFEVGPKSGLCLHDRKRHGTVLTANYNSLYLRSDFTNLFHFSLILTLEMCALRQFNACQNILPF